MFHCSERWFMNLDVFLREKQECLKVRFPDDISILLFIKTLSTSSSFMFISFLVFLFIFSSSSFVHSTIRPLYLTTGTALVFMAFAVFPLFRLDFKITLILERYFFLISIFL